MSRMSVLLVGLLPGLAGLALAGFCALGFLSDPGPSAQKPIGALIVGALGALLGVAGVATPALGFVFTPGAPGSAKPKKEATEEPGETTAPTESAAEEPEELVGDEEVLEEPTTGSSEIIATDDSLEVMGSSSEFGDVDSAESSSLNVSGFDDDSSSADVEDLAEEDDDQKDK